MGLKVFDKWVTELKLDHECPLAQLHPEGCVGNPIIGIDAEHFLEQFHHPLKEPLVPALGGFPLALEAFVMKQLNPLKDMGVVVWFYFNGLETSFDKVSLQSSIEAARIISNGYDVYDGGNPEYAIQTFRDADTPSKATLNAYLKTVLYKHGIQHVTAPFRAIAQMAKHLEQDLIHTMFASYEAVFYTSSPFITRWNMNYENIIQDHGGRQSVQSPFKLENATYTWIDMESCRKAMGDVTYETLQDALFLTGTSYTDIFPPLLSPAQDPDSLAFPGVIALLGSCQNDIRRLLDTYQHDERVQRAHWVDSYKKAAVAIAYMPYLKSMTEVVPRNRDQGSLKNVPHNLHDLIGVKLPEEAIYYVYNGLISPKVLNWLITGSIKLSAPLMGGTSPQLRKLIKDALHPQRQQALALLGHSVNRWFLSQKIVTTVWFDDSEEEFTLKGVSADKDVLGSWRVKDEQLSKMKAHSRVGSLQFAFESLTNVDAVTSTIGAKKSPALETSSEIVANTVWRFLYLRGYIDQKHQLSPWGKLLGQILTKLGEYAPKELAESAFVAVEMIRLRYLIADPLVPGESINDNESNKLNAILFSRLATTGKMQHNSKGYTGPLDRSMLAFHCMVSEVRRTLRDTVEMTAATLFLDNHAKRLGQNYTLIAQQLPFQEDWCDGLGLVVKTYLDVVRTDRPGESEALQAQCMEKAEGYITNADVKASYKDAFKLWTVIADGIKNSGPLTDVETKKLWAETDSYVLASSVNFSKPDPATPSVDLSTLKLES